MIFIQQGNYSLLNKNYFLFVRVIIQIICKEDIVLFLQMDDVEIRKRRGCLHFIRFQTTDMGNFLSLAKQKGMAELVTTACATGGGAFKFENDFREVIDSY